MSNTVRGVGKTGGRNSPHGALPLFIGGGDRLGGEGVQNTIRMATINYSLLMVFTAPPHHYVVPSPYKQGESAMRPVFTYIVILP